MYIYVVVSQATPFNPPGRRIEGCGLRDYSQQCMQLASTLIVQYFRTMSLRWYFQPATTLPTACQTQLSPNVLQEVNQAVRALQRKENGASRRPLSHQKIALASGSTLAKMATQQSHRNAFIRFAM